MNAVILSEWPGKITALAGGTRNAVNLDRPWQKEMVINRDACPFCAEERPGADRSLVVSIHDHGDAGEWKVRRNRMTPFPYHRLILPLCCYDKDVLWQLGSERNIAGALYTAKSVMCGNAAPGEETPGEHVFFYVHVGYSAGQRWGHEHWHFTEPPRTPTMTRRDLFELVGRKHLVVFENDGFTVVAGGCRAGQCYIIPDGWKDSEQFWEGRADVLDTLALILHRLIALFNAKFKSAQGLPPDFEIFVRFTSGLLVYAKYIPILNMWGGSEYAAIDELTPFVLPWPHETTVKHLLS